MGKGQGLGRGGGVEPHPGILTGSHFTEDLRAGGGDRKCAERNMLRT